MSETIIGPKTTKVKNPYRINLAKLAEMHGHFDVVDFLNEVCSDSVVPALCTEGCEVEPDGYCCHGCPSPLISLGII
jgi:hypothetical protein